MHIRIFGVRLRSDRFLDTVLDLLCRCNMTLTNLLEWGLMVSTPLLLDGVSGIGMIEIVILVITTISLLWISSLMHQSRQSMQAKPV